MSNHTPGPWVIEWDRGVDEKGRVRISSENWGSLARVVVRMDQMRENAEEGEANAALIAAAPDLYEALSRTTKAMADDWVGKPVHDRADIFTSARAALAKASGTPLGDAATHKSDCAIHNAPALPPGPCDCGAETQDGSPQAPALEDK